MAMLSEALLATDLVDGWVTGDEVAATLRDRGLQVEVQPMVEETGKTDFLRIEVPGSDGRLSGGHAPTTGVVGRLGASGSPRRHRLGLRQRRGGRRPGHRPEAGQHARPGDALR